MALANMTQDQTNQENRNHCKQIAEDVEAYVDGTMYRCPTCGEIIPWSEARYNDADNMYQCQACGDSFDADDLEPLSIWDYMENVLDVEYRCGSGREYRSVRVMVAFGGPNIYIDTATKQVELYWWTDRASYPISYAAAEALDDWAEDYWNCL